MGKLPPFGRAHFHVGLEINRVSMTAANQDSIHSQQKDATVRVNALGIVVAVGLLGTGCQSISSSVRFDERILVKVPGLPSGDAVCRTNGWSFKPIVAATSTNFAQPLPAQWYMAWKDYEGSPIKGNLFDDDSWKRVRRLTPELVSACHLALGEYPEIIEPNLIFAEESQAPKTNGLPKTIQAETSGPEIPTVTIAARPSKVWPIPKGKDGLSNPFWHLDTEHSQLKDAREYVESHSNTSPECIRIGILDNGFDASHVVMPKAPQMVDLPEGNAVSLLLNEGDNAPIASPGAIRAHHGTGTMSLLAGGRVRVVEVKNGKTNQTVEYVGAAPNSTIVPVRIAPWVFSLSTANLAYGIDYASRRQKCDVLSLSHGGGPSLIWVDAINAAYERGTAIFAATGDFYHLSGTELGVLVPSSTVYPASFRRVIGVTGVTADGKTYAKNNCFKMVRAFWSVSSWLQWFMRGSYGADFETHWIFGSNDDPDPSQCERNGRLRPYPIAAYTPNVPWAVSSMDESNANGEKNRLDLDGAGTSAATPQVAGAAALWLQANAVAIKSDGKWNSWEKAEAVYVALLTSAERQRTNQPDHYLGAGILKARRALDISYSQVISNQLTAVEKKNGTNVTTLALRYARAPRDYFDGQRASAQLLMPWHSQPKVETRLYLRQSPEYFKTSDDAIHNILFNSILLECYRHAETPTTNDLNRLEKQVAKWQLTVASSRNRRSGE